MRIEEHMGMKCLCCDSIVVHTRHVRICPRAGAQVNQHSSVSGLITRSPAL